MQRLKKNKLFILFFLIIMIIGFTSGLIYYFLLSSSLKTDVINTLNSLTTIRYNAILKDLIIMSLLLVSSLLIIGIPLSIFYLLYESFSWGFITLAFLNTFK